MMAPMPMGGGGGDDVAAEVPEELFGFAVQDYAEARVNVLEFPTRRLPKDFGGRTVSFRVPYSMPGALTVPPNRSGIVFPEATFLHNVDKPFEIHRLVVRATALTGGVAATATMGSTQPDTLTQLVRLRITDFAKNENVTKSATLSNILLALNSGFWEMDDPYTLVRTEGFQVQMDTQAFPTLCSPDPDDDCQLTPVVTNFMRVEVAFQGYLIIVGPPSEKR